MRKLRNRKKKLATTTQTAQVSLTKVNKKIFASCTRKRKPSTTTTTTSVNNSNNCSSRLPRPIIVAVNKQIKTNNKNNNSSSNAYNSCKHLNLTPTNSNKNNQHCVSITTTTTTSCGSKMQAKDSISSICSKQSTSIATSATAMSRNRRSSLFAAAADAPTMAAAAAKITTAAAAATNDCDNNDNNNNYNALACRRKSLCNGDLICRNDENNNNNNNNQQVDDNNNNNNDIDFDNINFKHTNKQTFTLEKQIKHLGDDDSLAASSCLSIAPQQQMSDAGCELNSNLDNSLTNTNDELETTTTTTVDNNELPERGETLLRIVETSRKRRLSPDSANALTNFITWAFKRSRNDTTTTTRIGEAPLHQIIADKGIVVSDINENNNNNDDDDDEEDDESCSPSLVIDEEKLKLADAAASLVEFRVASRIRSQEALNPAQQPQLPVTHKASFLASIVDKLHAKQANKLNDMQQQQHQQVAKSKHRFTDDIDENNNNNSIYNMTCNVPSKVAASINNNNNNKYAVNDIDDEDDVEDEDDDNDGREIDEDDRDADDEDNETTIQSCRNFKNELPLSVRHIVRQTSKYNNDKTENNSSANIDIPYYYLQRLINSNNNNNHCKTNINNNSYNNNYINSRSIVDDTIVDLNQSINTKTVSNNLATANNRRPTEQDTSQLLLAAAIHRTLLNACNQQHTSTSNSDNKDGHLVITPANNNNNNNSRCDQNLNLRTNFSTSINRNLPSSQEASRVSQSSFANIKSRDRCIANSYMSAANSIAANRGLVLQNKTSANQYTKQSDLLLGLTLQNNSNKNSNVCHKTNIETNNNNSNVANRSSINATTFGISDFECETCGSSFDDRHRLMQHQSIHLELHKDWFSETPVEEVMKFFNRRRGEFYCEQCDLRFEATHDFDRHNNTVHGPRPYRCQFCGNGTRTFVAFRSMLNHLYDHRYVFKCKLNGCDFTVNRRDSLRFHIFRFHLNCQLPASSSNATLKKATSKIGL